MAKDLTFQISKIKENEVKTSLSLLFTQKQQEIISKVLDEQALTKTQSEYYSRIVRKRLEAIISVQEIAALTTRKKANRKSRQMAKGNNRHQAGRSTG